MTIQPDPTAKIATRPASPGPTKAPGSRHPPVALVTGASSGVGRAAVVQLAKRGYRTVAAARSFDGLAETAQFAHEANASVACLPVPTDAADPSACAAMLDTAFGAFGRIDALVLNAGFAELAPLGAVTPEHTRKTFAINALGPAHTVAAAWARLIAQPQSKPLGARIVCTSSMSVVDPFPGLFAYAAAKGSLTVLVKSIATEGAAHGIKGFAVAPGAIETRMLRGLLDESALPSSACLTPEAVAAELVACATGARDGRNGDLLLLPSPTPHTDPR